MVAEIDYFVDRACLNKSKTMSNVGNINNLFGIRSVREKSKCKFNVCDGKVPFR